MKKIKISWLVLTLILILVLAQSGITQSLSEYALIQRRIFANPDVWHLTKAYANSEWGVDLYAYPTSVSMVYIIDSTDGYVYSAMSFTSDYAFHRIVYSEAYSNWIRAYGSFGSSIGQFNSPSGIVSFNRPNGDWENHHIYVADTWNNRICGFTYNWSSQEINSPYEITDGGLVFPKDLDINNGGEFGNSSNDRLWVANGDQTIKKFDLNGNLLLTYDGDGHFGSDDLIGIACGRSYFTDPSPPYEPFANNNYIYVIEDIYIHQLLESPPGNIQYVKSYRTAPAFPPPPPPPPPWPRKMTSLEVDNVGQIWTTEVDTQTGISSIYKYTPDLEPLCYFNAGGIFNRLQSFSHAGGKWGCGNVIVLEEWGDESGALYYWIGTDILNYSTGSDEEHGHHYAAYILVDPALISVKVYNEAGGLIKTVKDTIPHVLNFSGWEDYWWDGYDNSGQIASSGNYRIEVTAYSAYLHGGTGEHVNTVSKDGWVYHIDCSQAPNAPSNLTAYNTGGCEASISLSWQDNSDDEDGFNIYRDGQLTGSVGANVTTFTQTFLNPGQTYSYYVKTYIEDCESEASNTVNQTPGPLTPEVPTNLQVVNVGECQFLATWQDNSTNEDGFVLYNGTYCHAYLGPDVTSFQGYWYPEAEWVRQSDFYVYAYDSYSCKAYSNHVVIDPPGGVIPAPSNTQLHGSECDWTATWQNNDDYDRCQVKHIYTGCELGGPHGCMYDWYWYTFFSSCGQTSIPPPWGCGCLGVSVRGGKWVDCGGLGNTKWSSYSNPDFVYSVICNNPNPGCPYLFVYDGERFMAENTILAPVEIASDRRLDVDDYYLVKQSVTPIDNMCKLRIAEFEQEHSFFDKVELLAVDHDFGLKVAVTGDGKIFVYNPANFLEPISCYDQNGASQDTLLLLDSENRVFKTGSGSLVLNFGPVSEDSTTQILLLPLPGPDGQDSKLYSKVAASQNIPQISLLVEVEKDGIWQEVDLIPPRMALQKVFIDLSNLIDPNQELKIKLSWDERGYSFSKFCCFRGEKFDQPKPLPLISASHSMLGDVTQKLTFDDNEYVELLPDQNIDLGFSDLPAEPGKVRDFVFECNGHYLTENLARVSTPSSEELQQNYPNPFNPQTQIQFNLVEASKVSLVIYNLLGQKVATLVDGKLAPGKHVINWNGEDESGQKVASGIYFYCLQAGEYDEVRKMILMK